jgi:hypothetical protein
MSERIIQTKTRVVAAFEMTPIKFHEVGTSGSLETEDRNDHPSVEAKKQM